jgi:hypothetical protein
MRDIYMSDEVYPYLELVSESDMELVKAREYFMKSKLDMKCYVNNSLFTWAGAKVNRTIALMCKLRLRKDLDYNYLRIYGIAPKDIAYILLQPKPKGDDLAALVSRSLKEKQKYDHFLSDELLNHEYACTYLDVEKAWKELQKLSSLKCEELPEMSIDSDSYDYDDEETYEEYEAATGYQAFDGIYDYRHIRDISNVIKYDTLAEPLNGVIHQYILDAGLDCEVMTGAMFPNAPKHAMPINFLLKNDDKEVAILLVHRSKTKRYSVQETEALCQEHGVDVRRFYFECDNEKEYVVERIRKALE